LGSYLVSIRYVGISRHKIEPFQLSIDKQNACHTFLKCHQDGGVPCANFICSEPEGKVFLIKEVTCREFFG